jgi:mitogen-activated protein kinase kinase kinase 1
VFDSSKNDLDVPKDEVSERIHDGHVEPLHYSVKESGKRSADNPQKEGDDDLQKDTSATDPHCDAPVCDRESVCSSCEEPRFGLNGEPPESRLSSEPGLTPGVTMGGQLQADSEDDTASRGLKHEISTRDQMVPPCMVNILVVVLTAVTFLI